MFTIYRDSSVLDEQPSTPEKGSGAKTKKRCGVCRCKLELAQRAIGRCKCGKLISRTDKEGIWG